MLISVLVQERYAMTKIAVPDQHGEMTEVELDPRGSGSTDWCGKHFPANPGYCKYHDGVPFLELHNEGIARVHGVMAIFYCPKLGCSDFDWDTRASAAPGAGFCKRQELPFTSENLVFGFEIFRSAVLLKILFLKQRQIAEKLGLLE